jgi:hypothetical protein
MLDKDHSKRSWNQRFAFVPLAFLAVFVLSCTESASQPDIVGPAAIDLSDEEAERDGSAVIYDQVEFLGNPLVSEVTIAKANHDAYNRTQPYNSAVFGPQSLAFINAFRGAQPVVANTLGAVLYPDMLIVESSRNPATAGWLSWALAAGWGGRKFTDDVVDAGLSAIFGKIVTAAGAYCDNFTLPLCTDNVGANDKAFSNSFPYLAAPTAP